MNSEQLNAKYDELLFSKSSLLRNLSLSSSENYYQLDSLAKRKILINLININNTIETDMNQIFKTVEAPSLIEFGSQNYSYLNDESK